MPRHLKPSIIAALFIQPNGCYSDLEDVEPWDETRDARTYIGPWPVIAHPPCQRWGNYWYGSPSSSTRFNLGSDAGCFIAALAIVRRFGGVLEHPAGSRAWKAHGLQKPMSSGNWVKADDQGGWTCCVDQGHYGHRARKPTWLYSNAVDLPNLQWGKSTGNIPVEHMSKQERAATPIEFRDILLSIARSARHNHK